MSVRRTLVREVTRTTVKLAKMKLVDGSAKAIDLPDEILLGNINLEKAQRAMDKKFKGESVTVLEVQAETKKYEMDIERFISLARIKE